MNNKRSIGLALFVVLFSATAPALAQHLLIGDLGEGWRNREAAIMVHKIAVTKTGVEDWYTQVWANDQVYVVPGSSTAKWSFLNVWVGKYDAYTGYPIEELNLTAALPNKLNSERDSLRVEEFANGAMLILRNVKACDPWNPAVCRSVDGRIPWYALLPTVYVKGSIENISWETYYSFAAVYDSRETRFSLKIGGRQVVDNSEIVFAYVREDSYAVSQ